MVSGGRDRERERDGERRRDIDRGRVFEGREKERGREIRDEEKGSQRDSEGIRGRERESERV